jgi:hypothetical protein
LQLHCPPGIVLSHICLASEKNPGYSAENSRDFPLSGAVTKGGSVLESSQAIVKVGINRHSKERKSSAGRNAFSRFRKEHPMIAFLPGNLAGGGACLGFWASLGLTSKMDSNWRLLIVISGAFIGCAILSYLGGRYLEYRLRLYSDLHPPDRRLGPAGLSNKRGH